MQHHSCHILKHTAPDNEQLSRDFYEILREADPGLAAELPLGLATLKGDRLHLKTAKAEQHKMLAIEVLDTHAMHLWEMSLAQLPNGKRIGCRRSIWQHADSQLQQHDLLDIVWSTVFGDHHEAEPFEPRNQPHFLALAAACAATQGLVTKDDSATIRNLQHDVEYWMGQAKVQSRLLKKPTSEPNGASESQHRVAVAESQTTEAKAERSWSLKEMDQWAALNSDRITILPRAISEAKRSNYHDPALVYTCLELLAGEYTALKRREATDRKIFKNRAAQLGLDYGGSVEPSVAGECGDQYFIRWRGQRRFLDQHLTKGNARDPRYCLRIYYTWDEVDGKVVVGWLPSHLGNSET